MDFFKNSILTLGEDTVLSWFEMLGYDKSLFSLRSRSFIFTVHSDHEIQCTVRDSVQTDLDSKTNAMIIDARGTDMETCQKENQGVIARYYLSKGVHCYSYGVTNLSNVPVEVTQNCSGSKEMSFSTKTPVIKKRVEPHQKGFMLHAEALQTVENFTRSAVCSWININ